MVVAAFIVTQFESVLNQRILANLLSNPMKMEGHGSKDSFVRHDTVRHDTFWVSAVPLWIVTRSGGSYSPTKPPKKQRARAYPFSYCRRNEVVKFIAAGTVRKYPSGRFGGLKSLSLERSFETLDERPCINPIFHKI